MGGTLDLNDVKFGGVNANNLMCNKVGRVSMMLRDFGFDVLPVTETWPVPGVELHPLLLVFLFMPSFAVIHIAL